MKATLKALKTYRPQVFAIFIAILLTCYQALQLSNLPPQIESLPPSDVLSGRDNRTQTYESKQIIIQKIYKEYAETINILQQNIFPLIPISIDPEMSYCIKIQRPTHQTEYPSYIERIKLGIIFYMKDNATTSEILIANESDNRESCTTNKITSNVLAFTYIIYPDSLTYARSNNDPYHRTPESYLAQRDTDTSYLKLTISTLIKYFAFRLLVNIVIVVNLYSVIQFFLPRRINT
jgi:hypothetical protein